MYGCGWLWSFRFLDSKLVRFLLKSKLIKRKTLYVLKWNNAEPTKIGPTFSSMHAMAKKEKSYLQKYSFYYKIVESGTC